MTDRDRLIELILKSEILCNTCGEYSNTYCAEALADHLLANGVIVPPCRVGDKVYYPYDYGNKVLEKTVKRIVIKNNIPHQRGSRKGACGKER